LAVLDQLLNSGKLPLEGLEGDDFRSEEKVPQLLEL